MPDENFCVIGAVAAGMSAASQIKRRRPDSHVVVLEKGHDVSYGACGMPYNIADPSRDVEDLVVIPAGEFIEKRKIDLRLGHEATEIERKARVVRGVKEDGQRFEVPYDKLVLATGSRAILPEIPGIRSPGVYTLRTLRDCADIKRRLSERTCTDAVVIGGSYLGIELCEALHRRGLKVTIVKRSPVMLYFLPEEMDQLVREEIEEHGVEVIHGRPIMEVQPGERLKVKVQGAELAADIVAAGTGFKPCSELGLNAGLEEGAAGAIAVDEYGRTSDPDVFAVGDCADAFHHVTGKRFWPPLALRANRSGRIAGANACGASREIPTCIGTSAVKAFGLEVAGTGLSEREAQREGVSPVSATIKARTRAHAYPGAGSIRVHMVADPDTGRVIGGAIVGDEKAALRINLLAAAVQADMTVEQFSGLDLMYTPPFAPAWDPLLVCANQLAKKL